MKETGFWLYQQFTKRRRAELLEALQEQRKMPIAILFYHRVADADPNPWTINRRDFVNHLNWLQENYEVVSLSEAQRRIRSETCDQPSVAITFDDGYGDNVEFAMPELLRRNLPATYFVSTEFISTGMPFPHDVQAGKPLRPNTINELRSLAHDGFEIGAHTKNHIDLGAASKRLQQAEICESITALEDWLGRRVHYFAAPYGLPQNLSQTLASTVRDLELDGFCSAYGALNWPNNCGFHLRRIHADPGLQRLTNWLTLDSRKLTDQTSLPFAEPIMNFPQLIT